LRLHSQLGRGGFAPVWLASEVYDDIELRSVAVKLFSFAAGELSAPTRRYREHVIREARTLCQVEHPNIVRFYSLVIENELGLVALVMEYLRGQSLSDRLSAAGRLNLDETLEIGLAVASALEAAHAVGIVHRDVKPANVMHSEDAHKLIDFGISADEELEPRRAASGETKAIVARDLPLDAAGTKLTMTVETDRRAADESTFALAAAASGTVGYIDPECVAGATAVPASDLYSLGALLFQCVAGVLPAVAAAGGGKFRGEVLDGRIRPPRVEELAPETPSALSELIHHLLAPSRIERPASASDVVRRLKRLQAELSSPVHADGTVPASLEGVLREGRKRPSSAPVEGHSSSGARSGSRRRLVGGAVAATAVTLVALWALREPRSAGGEESASSLEKVPVSIATARSRPNDAPQPAATPTAAPIAPNVDGSVEPVATTRSRASEQKRVARRIDSGHAAPVVSADATAAAREEPSPATQLVPKDEF
jgi:serine/threonine protein kinase